MLERPLTDAEFDKVLASAWKGIVSRMVSGSAPTTKTGIISSHRVLHFKDIHARLEYESRFTGDDFFNKLGEHIQGMATELSLLRFMGTDPRRTWSAITEMLDDAAKDRLQTPKSERAKKTLGQRTEDSLFNVTREAQFNIASGEGNRVANVKFAYRAQQLRAGIALALLPKAVLAAQVDHAYTMSVMRMNGLPIAKVLGNHLKGLSDKEHRRWLSKTGQVMSTMMGPGSLSNRFAGDGLEGGGLAHAAKWMFYNTGLEGHTDLAEATLAMELMGFWGEMKGTPYAQLSVYHKNQLGHALITENEWEQIRKTDLFDASSFGVKPEDDGFAQEGIFMHPAGIRHSLEKQNISHAEHREVLALKFASLIEAEKRRGVPAPSVLATAMTTGGLPRGSLWGETTRTLTQLLQFPISVFLQTATLTAELMRHAGVANGLAYIAQLMALATLGGAIHQEVKLVLDGKQPTNPLDPEHAAEFWARSWLLGGATGYVGDFTASITNPSFGKDLLDATFPAPAFRLATAVVKAGRGAAQGDGGAFVSLQEGWTPFFSRLPFFSLVYKRVFVDYMRIMLDPNAAAFFRRRAARAREQGTEYIMPPGGLYP